jgi:hypothetical protein
MKLPIAFSVAALAIGMISTVLAGPAPVSGGSGGVTTQPVVSGTSTTGDSTGGVSPLGTSSNGAGPVNGPGASSETSSTGVSAAATPNEGNTDENDDTLYRGKTSESENPMMRDEGRLHFKTKPKEKIQEVDSLKKLQTSRSDPKFQSNLLFSGVSSIENVGAKASESDDPADESDPRFKTRRLVFTPEKNDQPKQAQSDSSPSPTPSPTASPAAKSSSKE